MKTNNWWSALKGFVVGGTMLVPGVSGGSVAMILGIYNKLISAISSFKKDKKNNFWFLMIFVLGAVAGILIMAKPLETLIIRFPKPMLYLFMGAVFGSAPMIYKESGAEKVGLKEVLYILGGVVLVVLCSMIPRDFFNPDMNNVWLRFFLLLLAGFIAAIALVLPGISVSYMLLVLGVYEDTLDAIGKMDILFLVPLGIGVLGGVLLTTKTLEWAMNKYPKVVYLVILGFVLGSLVETFPGLPVGWELLICMGTLLFGFSSIYFLSKKKKADA